MVHPWRSARPLRHCCKATARPRLLNTFPQCLSAFEARHIGVLALQDLKEVFMQVVHSARPVVPRDRLLRLADVEATTGCKKSTIYKLMKEGKFPCCVYVTSRMVAWPESAVLTWVQERIAATTERGAQ